MKLLICGSVLLVLSCSSEVQHSMSDPHRYTTESGSLRVGLVKMPYHGGRNVPELSRNPDYLEAGGIADSLADGGMEVRGIPTVALTDGEEEEYGEWHRLGLANGHLAHYVAQNERSGVLTVGFLANCNALMGMLAGLQHSGADGRLQTVGLVWIDAHGDFNTPETTLSGMLGGMPVAVSAGLALHRLRTEAGLDPPISTEHIVMAGIRDLDPEEADLVKAHRLAELSVQDLLDRSDALHGQMRRLSEETDIIYVHIDMDVLDPREVQGHGLTVAGGPTSDELAAAVREMFTYGKVAALGIASTPAWEADPEELSRQAAYRLIRGALEGVQARQRAVH